MLGKYDLYGTYIRDIRYSYQEQKACILIKSEKKKRTKCEAIFSLNLKRYNEKILRKLEGLRKFLIGENNLNNIIYADDTILTVREEGKLKEI